jgi:hypothetical protein
MVQNETGRFIPVPPGWEIVTHFEEDGSTSDARPLVGWLLVDHTDGTVGYVPATWDEHGFLWGEYPRHFSCFTEVRPAQANVN